MIRAVITKYRNLKLSHKLVLFFVVVSVIPIVMLQGYNYLSTGKQSTRQIDKVIGDNLVQIAERTNLTLEIYTNLLYQIYVDEAVMEEIGILMNGTQTRRAAARSSLRERLRQYTSVVEGIRCVSLVCANGETVTYDYLTDSSVKSLWARFTDMRMSPPYMEAVGRPGMVITPTMQFLDGEAYQYYFHISKRLFDFDRLEKGSIGTVILTIDERILNEIGNPVGDGNENGIYYILSSETGKLVSYPNQEYIARTMEPSEEEMIRGSGFLGSSRISRNRYEDENTGWIFCNAYDVDLMLSDLRHSQRIIIVTSLVVLGLLGVTIFITIKQFNRSVQNVVDGMQMVENGNLDTRIEAGSGDEIGRIARSFNHMTARVQELIDQVGAAKDRQREAEIQALEAQINPHFLYNTLDSINWMAIEHGEKEISQALRDLGLILRHSVNHSNEKTTVAEEISFLKRYLQLQDIRYEGAFEWHVEAQEEVLDYRMHKLLVQPFVENAVIHGMEGVESGGEIRVEYTLSEDRKYLQISIADNGAGIDEALRDRLNDQEWLAGQEGESPAPASGEENVPEGHLRSSLGLPNALGRLVMYYGESAHWSVNSVRGIGTEVILYLPVGEQDENCDH